MTSGWAGLLLVDKPEGWTSHDVVAVVRRMLPKGTKAGHCGTLDPLATGLLMILIGEWTRLQERFQGLDKVYSGKIRLGISTDTGDITGKVTAEKDVPDIGVKELQAMLTKRIGRLEMAAPAYSAVKHQGKKLYEYARAGAAVPVKPRISTVYEWTATSYAKPDFEHRLKCSSGTYVRSLAELIGADLGCGATVATLRRDSVDRFKVADAATMEQLKAMSSADLQKRLESLSL